jgi:TIR domain
MILQTQNARPATLFLHDGILRNYLSKLGEHAKDAAVYWKYGCWFYEQKTRSQVLINSSWDDPGAEAGPGTIHIEAWGDQTDDLVRVLIETLRSIPLAQRPEITGTPSLDARAQSVSTIAIEARFASSRQVQTIKIKDLVFGEIMKDFFVSYTHADRSWAEWIAWQLEEAGHSTVIDVWDFRAGSNFVLEMQKAASIADRTIAVLSQNYLESSFTASEWAAAFAQDPQGRKRKLIPIRVAPCDLTGILKPIVYLDLLGLPEKDARAALLGAFSERNKPPSAPAFPGREEARPAHAFPGPTNSGFEPIAETLLSKADAAKHVCDPGIRISQQKRMALIQQLSELAVQQFNMLIFAAKPPAGLIPPMPAPQGDRAFALLSWAEGPGGCSVVAIQELLATLTNPQ